MNFKEKLKQEKKSDIWQEYCGFLDLSIDEYMTIQNRLLMEQLHLWNRSELGQRISKAKAPRSIDEFRATIPLTHYEDYAEILLQKRSDSLPDDPVLWIQTTWEGGHHPIKIAPYTSAMLDTFKHNAMTCLILATSNKKGDFTARPQDTILYGLAPLPYATGLVPVAFKEEVDLQFLPPVEIAQTMDFSSRNQLGFKMGLKTGIDYFFGLGSVTYYISKAIAKISQGGNSSKSLTSISPKMALRLLKASKACKKENRDMMPKDLFKLKGFMVAGTDNEIYKDELEELWGIRPMEIFAGTEPTCIGTETWSRNGLYFFPDACFYEFIPEEELKKERLNPRYVPKTYTMEEVISDTVYEIVISVLKGGAFMRYRVGDMYRCVGLKSSEDQTRIPRFKYIDRVPDVIDIAGFTRITKNSINKVIELSHLNIAYWVAAKEYRQNRPFLHLYVELNEKTLFSHAISKKILYEHLTVYFKYVDQDYHDLQKILGIEPLKITILKSGTFKMYEKLKGAPLQQVNPSQYELLDLVKLQEKDYTLYLGGEQGE